MSAVAPTGRKPSAPRPKGSRPELLDRLPTSFFGSPAVYAIGLAVALLYGMVLFGVVSARRHRRETEASVASVELPAAVAPVTPEPAATKAESESPKAEPPPSSKSNIKPSEETSRKTEVAVKKVAPPVATPAPDPVEPQVDRWGELTGPPADTRFRTDGDGLTINIPNTLHILSPDLKTKNAPKLLTDVSGDFQAQVRVLGRILPGTDPLPTLPFTFQGAGLLIWENEDNYLRLERTASYSAEGKKHQVFVEYCRDGRLAPLTVRDSREGETLLKFERKGSEVRCSYSPDNGKTWLEVKRQPVGFPAAVQVGVSASNASRKPFAARLEGFQLSGPGAKGGKGS